MPSLKLVVILAQCRCTKIVQRILKYSDILYTTVTPDKIMNSLIYRTLFYVIIYRSYICKNSPVFGPPCTCHTLAIFIVVRIPHTCRPAISALKEALWQKNYASSVTL